MRSGPVQAFDVPSLVQAAGVSGPVMVLVLSRTLEFLMVLALRRPLVRSMLALNRPFLQ